MRKIIVSTFVSMDGVLQAPGGPTEDPTNNFKYGGWMFPYSDEVVNEFIGDLLMNEPYDLLLGRRTYQIFAAYWPYQGEHPITERFNSAQKYVVSGASPDLTWENSTLISGDVVSQLKALKQQDGPNLVVQGSGKLIQTLLQHNLIDELHTLMFPITLGHGKKLFEEGVTAAEWKLTDHKITTTGTVITSYIPHGDVKTGSFAATDMSELEKARQTAMAKGDW
jgi:dihydrofolate reductase